MTTGGRAKQSGFCSNLTILGICTAHAVLVKQTNALLTSLNFTAVFLSFNASHKRVIFVVGRPMKEFIVQYLFLKQEAFRTIHFALSNSMAVHEGGKELPSWGYHERTTNLSYTGPRKMTYYITYTYKVYIDIYSLSIKIESCCSSFTCYAIIRLILLHLQRTVLTVKFKI